MRSALLALALLLPGLGAAAAPAPAIAEAPHAARDLDGVVRDAYGLLAPPGAPPAEAGHAYLRARAAELGILDLGALEPSSVRASLTGQHLRFRQTWDGLPVVGGEVSVHVRHDGAVLAVHSRAVQRVGEVAEPVGSDAAVAAARAVAEGEPVDVRPVILARGLEGARAWEVRFHRALPLSAWLVHVDQATGEVLQARDTVLAADAEGRAWINPIVQSRDPDLRDTWLTTERDPVGVSLFGTRDLTPYYLDVNLTELEEGANGPILAGPYVRIGEPLASGTDLRFAREDPRFEEVNAYHWVDWSQRRIRELGFADITDYVLPVFAHDQVGVFNAFYAGNGDGTGELHFGWHAPTANVVGTLPLPQGFADAAEDAEVVLHEFGHAILDNQVPGFFSQEGGAMHEGFGDFWAAAQLSRVSGGAWDHCTAEWFTSYLTAIPSGMPPCLRNLENDLTYDYESPDGHLTGQIWSGALWDLRKELGNEGIERLLLEAHFLLPQDGGFHDGAEALLMADHALNGARNARLIVQEFAARNITRLIVTPELLTAIEAADAGIAPQATDAGARPTPGAPAAVAGLLVAAAALLARRRP